MPEFDTEGIIKRYACNNTGLAEYQAYRLLKRRTVFAIRWRVMSMFPQGDLSRLYDYCIGAKQYTNNKDMADMTEQERRKMFLDACGCVGLPIDPETFSRINEY